MRIPETSFFQEPLSSLSFDKKDNDYKALDFPARQSLPNSDQTLAGLIEVPPVYYNARYQTGHQRPAEKAGGVFTSRGTRLRGGNTKISIISFNKSNSRL